MGGIVRDGDLTDAIKTRESAAESKGRADRTCPGSAGGGLRYLWTQLTSMRTALVLLFALALAAIPGSLVPQRRVSPVRVTDFLTEHPTLGPIYDKVGLFGVYTSPWFSAIYLLLFVSLVGCIIPRVGVYARALRARPPRTPRNLARLPAYATADTADHGSTGVLDRAASRAPAPALPGRRQRATAWRPSAATCARPAIWCSTSACSSCCSGWRSACCSVSAAPAWSIVGQGFSNNLTQYDDFSAGAQFGDGRSGAVQRHGEGLRREVRDRRGATRSGAGCSGPMSR